MKQIWGILLSMRTGAILTLLSFLPTAVNAQMFLPQTILVVATTQAAEPRDTTSVPGLAKQTDATKPEEPQGPPIVRALPKPFALAQATTEPSPTTNPALNPQAQSLLDEAATLEQQGDPVRAVLTLFEVMETYPNSAEAYASLRELTRFSALLLQGTFPEPLIAVFEQQLPTYDQCTAPESKYIVSAYYYFRALAASERGLPSVAETNYGRAYDTASRFVGEFPQNPLILVVLQQLMASAHQLGEDVELATAYALAETAKSKTFNFNTWAVRAILGEYYATIGNTPEQLVTFQDFVDQTREAGIDELLSNSDVWPVLKAQALYFSGLAQMGLGEHAAALTYFQRVFDEYPGEGSVSEISALLRADMIDHVYTDDPDRAILAMQEVVDRYPQSEFAASAKYFMARVYSRWKNYDYAVNVLESIAQNQPNARVAARANDGVSYLLTERWDGTAIARAGDPGTFQLAQVCGPAALQQLLALNGIDSSIAELAAMSGTDDSGTSMLALAKAAAKKGLELRGVDASNLAEVSAPFIAFVKKNHFVLVESVDGDSLLVRDMGKAPESMSVVQFAQDWNGEALILQKDGRDSVAALDEESLSRVVGGSGTIWFGCTDLAGSGLSCIEYRPHLHLLEVEPGCNGGNTESSGGGGGGGGSDCSVNKDPADAMDGGGGFGGSARCSDPAGGSGGFSIRPRGGLGEPLKWPVEYWRLGSGVDSLDSTGISGSVGALNSSQRMEQRDVFLKTKGGLSINFTRNFENPKGMARSYFESQDKPFKDNAGKNWTHSLNTHILTGQYDPPGSFVNVDGSGASLRFVRDDGISDANWHFYKAGMTWIKRHKTNHNFIQEHPNGFKYEYSVESSNGYARLEKVKDKIGNEITYSYNNSSVDAGYLTKVSMPSCDGRYLQIDYSGNRMSKVSVKVSGGTTVKYIDYAYNGSGMLTKVAHDGEADGIKYEFTQPSSPSGSLYINKITDRAATDFVFSLEYDGTNATKVIATYPSGLETRALRSTVDGTATIRDWDNASPRTVKAKTAWIPNANGNVTDKQMFADDTTTVTGTHKFSYDSNKRLTKTEVPGTSGAYFTFAYDSDGRVVSKFKGVNSSDPTWAYSYASSGQGASASPTKITNPDGTVTDLYWDSNKRLTNVIDPEHGTSSGIQYFYNIDGELTKTTDAANKDWLSEYDCKGRLTKAKNPSLQEVVYSYDDLDRVTTVTDPMGKQTIYEYAGGFGCGSCAIPGVLTKVRQAYGSSPVQYRDTQFQYNANGKVAKVIDPLNRATDLFYDIQNRLTKTTYAGKSTTVVFNELNQVSQVTDTKGTVTSYGYDSYGRVTSVTDPVDDVAMAYDTFGNLTKVTDGNGHYWTYAYGAYNRLTKVTDPSSKYLVYSYDAQGRVTKVGGGSTGTFYPITYTYSTGTSGTGVLTRVDYDTSSAGGWAAYEYDAQGRISTMNDPFKALFSLPKLQYFYDDDGRLTRLYDGTNSFYYYYNAAGAVTKQTDWGGRDTTYVYDDLHQLTTMTYLAGTGNAKSWSFGYTGAGEPDSVTAPNGMVTDYVYDSNGFMTDLLHKSGSTVKQGFSYLYDAAYNITKITHEDSSYWTYAYDNRYRLTSAVRHNAADTIQANYSYSYDAGDNLLTKVEPWVDNFADGTVNEDGLTAAGTWSVVSGAAQNATSGTAPALYRTVNDDDIEFRYAYSIDSYTAATPLVDVNFRYNTTSAERLLVRFRLDQAELRYHNGTSWTTYTDTSVDTTAGARYNVRVELDGANVKVWRSTGGGMETLIFSRTDAPLYNGNRLQFSVAADTVASLDDIMIFGSDSDLKRETTFTVANNNELATGSDYNGSTTYAYDVLGRMSTETKNSVTKTFTWTMANLLAGVASSDPNEIDVTYAYTGDLKRGWRLENGSLKNSYQWDAGFNEVSETSWSGGSPVATKTFAAGLAEVDVTGTPSYAYLTQDHLGSTRGLWDGSIIQVGLWEYTPYGAPYKFGGPSSVTALYTGHDLDKVTGSHYAPFRTLSSSVGRWLSQDPLGTIDGTNMYPYAGENPIYYTDPDGRLISMAMQGILEFLRDGYESADEAANAAIRKYNKRSVYWDKEYAGSIYEKNGRFYYTKPNEQGGPHRSVHTMPPPGTALAGLWHTHGAESGPRWDDENFSPRDLKNAFDYKVPVYLGTPSRRIKRFDPWALPTFSFGSP